ncbi:hypothetical protein [Qipengyuania sp. MTN3-11]|uniref:hypothetical protein n=1 Tax=Qipengyuania sp. MTN3-11 TaxID=3056557 RepID=UPI0036F2E40B
MNRAQLEELHFERELGGSRGGVKPLGFFGRALFALVAGACLVAAVSSSDALFGSEEEVFEAVAELGAPWSTRPIPADFPRPRSAEFMPYQFDEERLVIVHRDDGRSINRIVLSDLNCWADGRKRALQAVIRISDAKPEAMRTLEFAATLVFDHDTKVQSVQAGSNLWIQFQRSRRKSRCGIEIKRVAVNSE